MEQLAVSRAVFRERQFGLVNWLGFWTLYLKEVRRFMKVYTQTLLAPMSTALLYMAIFVLAMGAGNRVVFGVSYAEFLAPGLMMMAITQNAFANTSSSFIMAKVQGNIVDLLMPPLSPAELTAALVLGGATRGVVVGVAVAVSVFPFIGLHAAHPGLVLFHGFFAALVMSTVGVLGGIWAEKFDHVAAVTNFVVMPLTFLSGTFYSVEALPQPWQTLAHFDPLFYMIDGFRYGFIGHADAPPHIGVAVMLILSAVLLLLSWRLFSIGYKLKA